jgi:hypothetical protein
MSHYFLSSLISANWKMPLMLAQVSSLQKLQGIEPIAVHCIILFISSEMLLLLILISTLPTASLWESCETFQWSRCCTSWESTDVQGWLCIKGTVLLVRGDTFHQFVEQLDHLKVNISAIVPLWWDNLDKYHRVSSSIHSCPLWYCQPEG